MVWGCSSGDTLGRNDDIDGDVPLLPTKDLAAGDDLAGQTDWQDKTDSHVQDLPQAPDPGSFGAPCASGEDCDSGYCIEGPNGYMCTVLCVEECPTGFDCIPFSTGPDVVFICVARIDRSCEVCSSDLHCAGGRCVDLDGTGYCLSSCQDQECPAQYQCQPKATRSGATEQLCVPKSGTCQCVPASIGLEKACKKTAGTTVCYGIQFCEAQGWGNCQLPVEICDAKDNDCNGYVDDPWLNIATGRYESDVHCGACNNSCTAMSADRATGKCDTSGPVPLCQWICESGYHDVNNNPVDGCECRYLSDQDDPDVPGDANCDGVEGVAANGVFVAKNGNDSHAGTIDAPLGTVQAGIDKAQASAFKKSVYVATGVYGESIVLRPGVSLFGGYSSDFLFRNTVSNQTVIMGSEFSTAKPGAVNAVNIQGTATTFSGFYVYGADAMTSGGSSYAVYVKDSDSSLIFVNNWINAGNGRAGASGADGSDGLTGVDGMPGIEPYDIMKASCVTSDWNPGGTGGSRTCGTTNVSGGQGGTADCPDFDESGTTQPKSIPYDQTITGVTKGHSGQGVAGGAGGVGGHDALMWDGAGSNCAICNSPRTTDGVGFVPSLGDNGANGGQGSDGAAGLACTGPGGAVVSGTWTGQAGNSGGTAGHGSGGGGGGGGGGVEVLNCSTYSQVRYTDIGGSGGGGGSGGCAGTPGNGGEAGGGSFGFFLVGAPSATSLPVLKGNNVQTGFGGEGGSGGTGGVGGIGGQGKAGGPSGESDPSAWCADQGGFGGSGGRGGHGGGGGGGCGGASFGIFLGGPAVSLAASYLTQNTFQLAGDGGTGGKGGKSLGLSGLSGAKGASGKASF
jgi:hypothetical protein